MAAFFHVAVIITDGDGGPEVGGAAFHDGHGSLAGNVVHLFLHGFAVDDVRKASHAVFFGHKGFIERIPLGQNGALGHFLAVMHHQPRAVGQNVFFPFAALRVHDGHLTALAEHQLRALAVGHGPHAAEYHPAGVERLELVLFNGA